MDLEALRKINALTGALRSGTGITSEEAFKQAENILQPLNEEKIMKETEETKTTTNTELLERKYQLMLDMNNKKFEQTIVILQQQISSLNTELNKLKTQIDTQPQHVHPPEPKITQPTQQPNIQEQKKDQHPRQGGFAPGDISIEKMFYFGKK